MSMTGDHVTSAASNYPARQEREREPVAWGCPACGSSGDISEANTVHVECPVTSWSADGEPQTYGEAEVLWDTIGRIDYDDDNPVYRCGCGCGFNEPVVIEPTDDDDAEAWPADEAHTAGEDREFLAWLCEHAPETLADLRAEWEARRDA